MVLSASRMNLIDIRRQQPREQDVGHLGCPLPRPHRLETLNHPPYHLGLSFFICRDSGALSKALWPVSQLWPPTNAEVSFTPGNLASLESPVSVATVRYNNYPF